MSEDPRRWATLVQTALARVLVLTTWFSATASELADPSLVGSALEQIQSKPNRF